MKKLFKILLSLLILLFIIQGVLIGEIYLNADKSIKLEKISEGKYEVNLGLRSFYIYDTFSQSKLDKETKSFTIESFPEKS